MKKINNAKILITGEAGFISSNLVDPQLVHICNPYLSNLPRVIKSKILMRSIISQGEG